MKRWTYGFLALLCGSISTFLAVLASELHTEGGHDSPDLWFYFSATVVFCASVVLMRFAIRQSDSP
jgi:hypothetical protein